jgi:hypothetical protein
MLAGGIEFPEECEDREDGTNPRRMMEDWAPWVGDAQMMMDGDGAWAGFWKYPGSQSDQPYIDMQIWTVAKNALVAIHNAELRKK